MYLQPVPAQRSRDRSATSTWFEHWALQMRMLKSHLDRLGRRLVEIGRVPRVVHPTALAGDRRPDGDLAAGLLIPIAATAAAASAFRKRTTPPSNVRHLRRSTSFVP